MTIKIINDIVDLNDMMFTLFMFETYLKMHVFDVSSSSIAQKFITLQNVIKKIKKIKTKRQVSNVINIKNDFIVNFFYDLSFNSN